MNSVDLVNMDETENLDNNDNLGKESYKDTLKKGTKSILFRMLWFAFLLMYEESVFHLWSFEKLGNTFFLKLLFCLPTAIILSWLVTYFPKKVNKVINWILSVIIIVFYEVHILYHAIFKVFFSIEFIDKTNTKVVQYYKEIIQGIIDNWVVISLALLVPIIALILLNVFKVFKYAKASCKIMYIHPVGLLLLALALWGVVMLYGKDEFSPYDLIKNDNDSDISIEKLGVIATNGIEIRNLIIPRKADLDDDLGVWVYEAKENVTLTTSDSKLDDVSANDVSGNDILVKPEKVIDTSPNILDIDFAKLSEEESNEIVAGIHRYMASLEPTYKNEYTGMFKGFNLILMTAEGFSSFAVDKEHTPTIYKMINEGFVFNNFYNARTGGSTSDGEFVVSTSLEPTNGGAKNFRIVGQNAMPFSMGNMFNRTYGITSRAFHDNDFKYYGRDITYPGMGYYYKGVGNGLDIPKHWPESDLDMMKASIPDYIDDEIFNIYYMTVSGHLNYNFSGNWCSKKHMEDVADLPYSEGCRAYIACQMEFDQALEYLISELEAKGIADRTVICFTGDHWPYGLSNEEISEILGHKVEETFELYKSNLILWSGAIKEPIVIDDPCCSMDIIPTLMNLFGFDYDSRLYMGRDILSDTEPMAVMFDKSFMTDKAIYYSRSGEVVNLTDSELPEDYIKNIKKAIANKWKYSSYIMDVDYYKYVGDALGISVLPVEQNYIPDYARFSKN